MSEERIEEHGENIIDAESVQVNVVCNRSERFRNIVVSIAVSGCLLVTGLNTLITRFNSKTTADTFSTLVHEAAQAQQIMVAQDYAMQVGQLAEYEASRAHELEEKISVFAQEHAALIKTHKQLQFKHTLDSISLKLQSSYIQQLTDFIEANNLNVPRPDMKDRTPKSSDQSQLQPAPNLDAAEPLITIEIIDEDGNVVDRQQNVIEDAETLDDGGN